MKGAPSGPAERREMSQLAQYSGACVAVFALASVCSGLESRTGPLFPALVFLLAVVVAGTVWQRGPVLLMATLSALVWNFIFIPPRYTLHIGAAQDVAMFVLFFVVALAMGHLTTRLHERERALARHMREREALLAEKHRAKFLAESERLHRTLLDSVSHELKTPLAVMQTALDGIPQDNAYAGEMRTAVHRLRHVVDGFLGMTRVESEALAPQPEWCEVADLVQAATAPLESELRGHALRIDVRDHGQSPLIRVDLRLLAQVLGNLLHNASAHGPPDGAIDLGLRLDSDRLHVTVRDHGAGLGADVLPRVFEKFYRAPDAPPGGTGLGLPIARGLVRALGGEITAGNHPEGGAVFSLSVPVETRTSAEA